MYFIPGTPIAASIYIAMEETDVTRSEDDCKFTYYCEKFSFLNYLNGRFGCPKFQFTTTCKNSNNSNLPSETNTLKEIIYNMMNILQLHYLHLLGASKLKIESTWLLQVLFSAIRKITTSEKTIVNCVNFENIRKVYCLFAFKERIWKFENRKMTPRLPLKLLIPVINMFLLPGAQGWCIYIYV